MFWQQSWMVSIAQDSNLLPNHALIGVCLIVVDSFWYVIALYRCSEICFAHGMCFAPGRRRHNPVALCTRGVFTMVLKCCACFTLAFFGGYFVYFILYSIHICKNRLIYDHDCSMLSKDAFVGEIMWITVLRVVVNDFVMSYIFTSYIHVRLCFCR
jgi:hypothetical protein